MINQLHYLGIWKPADDKTRSYGGGLFHFTMIRFID